MKNKILLLCVLMWSQTVLASVTNGVLILAHGSKSHDHGDHGSESAGREDLAREGESKRTWEKTIQQVAANVELKLQRPVEVAFGMWDQKSFQAGVDRLVAKGISQLHVVPLFISSHSSVIRAQRYQFGFSETNPLPFDLGRVVFPPHLSKVTMGSALDDNEDLSAIIAERAAELSRAPAEEELILVAHGPVSDEDDRLWLADMRKHAERIPISLRTHVFTLNDDAPQPIRDEKTRQLRALIQQIHDRGHEALVLPMLLASGGIEDGLIERLHGLRYRYLGRMLAPHPKLVDWVIRQTAN